MDSITEEFAHANCGDRRRTARLQHVSRQLWQRFHALLPEACQGWAEVQGAYRLWACPEVTLAAVIASHRQATQARAQAHPVIYAVQDTTELDFTGRQMRGLGPLNYQERRGLFWHMTLLVTPERVPLGVWHIATWARAGLDRRRTAARKREATADKESARWLTGYKEACALQAAVPDTQVISVADREGDIYEIFAEATTQQAAAAWVIRARHDRATVQMDGVRTQPLRLAVALAPVVCHGTVTIPATGNRAARVATVVVRRATVVLRPPFRKGERLPTLTVTVVSVRELAPPSEVEPLEWVLLTDLPVDTPAAAGAVVEIYAARWEIEVFFRTWKTGGRVEASQLSSTDRLEPYAGVLAVIAWRVLYLARLGATTPELPATVILSHAEIAALRLLIPPAHRWAPSAAGPSIGEAIRLIAGLGGFLGRTGDGPPGVETLWRGLRRVYDAARVMEQMTLEAEKCV